MKPNIKIKSILNFPSYYVGIDGSVWRHITDKHQGITKLGWKQLFPTVHPITKYLIITLRKGSKQYSKYIHRLVLESFVGKCPLGMECLHFDDDRTNNHLLNLRWGTRKDNIQDRKRNNRHNSGERNGNAKLKDNDVLHIRDLYKNKKQSYEQLAHKFQIKRATIYGIVTNRSWKHLL